MEVKKTEKSGDKWRVVLELRIPGYGLLEILDELERRFRDYSFRADGRNITVEASFRILEPWEDEPAEDVAESMALELLSFITAGGTSG
ncbi:hypothetical protein FVF72_02585 [Methanothermobacter sp. KEPCO-1]|uniref:hypothetical protein n=1 Tax=Methanothermobacter TaxID=145260 RepID=UPI0011C71A39|nr:hypothetical protein [Methanothermobacter sp. KEPCO-1]QEF94141.1 hypothetical protein FVF72_02585 [Methanothermobacter sp. KEPCO-1]QHN08438.1 hypothetical protein FZP68_06675 [Methanothermobacter sp. THM-2]